MAKARAVTRRQNNQNQETGSATTAVAAGALGATALSGAGGTTLTSCPPGDTSFYCQFVKGFNIFKMILFIIIVIVVAWFIYKAFRGGKRAGRR